ncbi:uncharacterized protein LOC124816994 [Hydra vulgaris]|uniref:uncharacterized protein LOC124816994 n=1 Tax=Hydra vulgaris TaxID=6087 RepID=UPI001F5E37EB|nr:uncharacterized protein LOC124816994 [Hydra vulgaris]
MISTNVSLFFINCSNTILIVPLQVHTNGSIYAIICLFLFSSGPIVFMNIGIIGVTYYYRKMHSPFNVLLAITSFWDLLVGMFANVSMAVVLIMSVSMSHNCVLFLFTIFTFYAFGFLSFLTVSMTSFDRYFAVFQPFFYQKHVDGNPRFYIKWNIIIATVVMLVTGFSFLTQNRVLCELFILSISPILIPLVLYIHTQLHNRAKLVRRQISAHNPNEYTSNEIKNAHQINEIKIAEKKVTSDAKINSLTMMVYLSTCFAYFPILTLLYLWHLKKNSYLWSWTHTLYLWSSMLTMLKSLTNPTIYFYRSKVLRRSLRRMKVGQRVSNVLRTSKRPQEVRRTSDGQSIPTGLSVS